jgi:uncharacterized membrane protein YgdD (TMEM256/DUF423 family)
VTPRFAATFASLSAAIAVAAGAFGAHALKERLNEQDLATWETAARYQVTHALALLFVSRMLARGVAGTALAGWGFVVGTIVFSGSLYLLVLLDQRWLGAVTPIGGVAFIAGWLALAAAMARH